MRRNLWLGLVVAALALWPLAHPSAHLLSRAVEVFMFAVVALSYDLLMGFTGIVSFGHALFFGAGAYAVAMLIVKLKWTVWLAVPAAAAVAAVLSALVGALSLRVKGHFFAMITLAFAELGHVVVLKWPATGGADSLGITGLPAFLANRSYGYASGRYLAALAFMALAYIFIRRVTESPAGRVFAAIRENEFRAGALGFNTTAYKVASMAVSGLMAGLAGVGYALMVQQGASPDWLSPDITVQALLMTIIGGVGTLHGPMLGAGVVRLLSYWLSNLHTVSKLFERWPLFFGLIYIAIVMFLPEGIVGTYRTRLANLFRKQLPAAGGGR